MSFRLKAGLGFALVLGLVVLPAAAFVTAAYYAAQRRDHVTSEYVLDLARAERLRGLGAESTAAARGYALSGGPSFRTILREAQAGFDDQLRELEETTRTAEGGRLLDQVLKSGQEYEEAVARLLSPPPGAARSEQARFFEEQVIPRRRDFQSALDEYVSFKRGLIRPARVMADAAFRRAVWASGLGFALAVLASALIAWNLAKQLTRSHRQAEESARRAEDALEARKELLGVVAHDLRNPLGALVVKAQIIGRMSPSRDLAEKALAIERTALSMELFLRNLLDASIIEFGHLKVKPAPCHMGEVLWEIVDLFSSQAAERAIHLDVRLDTPDLAVAADRERLKEVLGNLVGNALKFTPAHGHVTIVVEPVGDLVRLVVSDTGPGIAPEHLPHVFERYWSVDPSLQGTGLGLYISKGIVEAHGGSIWAESPPGEGATFGFTLPRTEAPRETLEPHPEGPAA